MAAGIIAILFSAAMTRHIILKFSFMKLSKDLHSLLLFYAFINHFPKNWRIATYVP